MTGSRERILEAVRRHQPPDAPLPPPFGAEATTYDDPAAQFAAVLEAVGGRCVAVERPDQINRALEQMPVYAAAQKIVSLVPGVGTPNVDLAQIDDPHDLADVDFAILPGAFAVAENAAVWVTEAAVRHRAVCFLPQHVALVVPVGGGEGLLHHLHEAYARLALAEPGFGLFISGPSKTADIEQSLVIGAHGPRSLTVFLLRG